MKLLGLPTLMTNDLFVDVDPAYQLFPHVKAGALARPRGQVGILLGLDQCDLHPSGGHGINQKEKLRVMNTPWGDVLMGHHPEIKAPAARFSSAALQVLF